MLSASEPIVVNLWPQKTPGEDKVLPPEADQSKPEEGLVAGRRVTRLGNVSIPQIAVYRPDASIDTGTAVIVCPGGGHYILAYDLEGTEVAQWLNELGVTAIVLKYRVPFRDPEQRWRAAVQDAQRAVSLVRHRSQEWNIRPDRIGILGFSAGGEVAARTSLMSDQRQYEAQDQTDQVSCKPNFSVLIYPAYLVDGATDELMIDLKVTDTAPPMFLVHTFDDRVPMQNSLQMMRELRRAGVPAELHIFDRGGHGYGLRQTATPVTGWPKLCEAWLDVNRWR